MFHTRQVRIDQAVSPELREALVLMGRSANDLENQLLFDIRQKHYETCPMVEFWDKEGNFRSGFKRLVKVRSFDKGDLEKRFKEYPHYQLLGGQQAQQTIGKVIESFKSYNALIGCWFRGEIKHPPKMPNYRKKGGLSIVTFPAQAVKFDIETGECTLPISREIASSVKEQIGSIQIPGCVGFNPESISEVRILFRNNAIYGEYVFKVQEKRAINLDFSKAMGIDPGLENWLTCVTNDGKSFIIDGRKIKSINQRYNKKVSELKTGKAQGYWDNQLADLTEKRNRTMRDAINKVARFIVNRCSFDGIGTVVFGWGQGIKQNINIGSVNNQNFVQIPTARLKNRIKQLCEEIGINFVETEESYTSKTSFLDDDFLPKLGEKPASWKPSGKRGQRVKGKALNLGRGGYQTAKGFRINSDCNGAANILRKVSTQLDICLAKVGRGALNLPKRYDAFSGLDRKYRKRCETWLQAV